MTEQIELQTLGLKAWPFDLVPDRDGKLDWADRTTFRRKLTRLARKLAGTPASSLHLFWADFGAGKTHSLLFLRQQALSGEFPGLFPIYAALPRAARSFVDVYRAIARAIKVVEIRDCYNEAKRLIGTNDLEDRLRARWPGIATCVQLIAIGTERQRSVALAWLHAEPGIPRKDLSDVSLTSRIRTTDEAVPALGALIELFLAAGHKRVVLMIDEFQRIGMYRGNIQEELNAGLHTLFNSCPKGIAIILSFSFGDERNISKFLNDELRDRADPVRFSLPALSEEEAVEFALEKQQAVLVEDAEPPIDQSTTAFVVDRIARLGSLTPRRVMKGMGLLLSEGRLDLEDEAIDRIDQAYAEKLFEDEAALQRIVESDDGEGD